MNANRSTWRATILLLALFVQSLQCNSNTGNSWSSSESAPPVQQPAPLSSALGDLNGATNEQSTRRPPGWPYTGPVVRRGGSRYCGANLVRALRLICNGQYAEPQMKRSYSPLALRTPNYANLLWRQVFNVHDNDMLTWPQLGVQYDLLFGDMDENGMRKYSDEQLQRLAASLRRLSSNNQDSGAMMDQDEPPTNSLSGLLFRARRGISNECCAKPCTLSYLKTYCKNRMLKRSEAPNDDYSE